MKYKIKQFMKADISKFYILGVGIICLLLIGGFFSYAMFTVSKEKSNAIRIVTGNLTYKLTVDGTEGNTLTVGSGETKTFTVTLSNNNNRTARFNFYYVGSIPSNVTAGYVTGSGLNTPPAATGINLEKADASGSSNTYSIRVSNNSSSSATITLGVSVGLDYNDLTLPSNGHLFEEAQDPTVAEVLLAGVGENGAINTTDPDQTFITGTDPNNYIWYSGKLWRAVSIDPSDNSVKLVTQWNISTTTYNPSNQTNFAGSYMESWLNDTTVDGFLGNLRDYENFIVTDATWDATLDATSLGSIARPNGTTVVTDAVGLLNMYEYQSSNNGGTDGYLNNGLLWWTLTPYNSSRVWNVNYTGNASSSGPFSAYGVRPSINLKSSVRIVDGDGTANNPYRLEGDNDKNLSGTLLSSRYSGEYIRFGSGENNLYRIVSHENGTGTKITSAEPLKDSGTFKTMSFGDTVTFSNTNTIGTFLNGEYLTNYVGSEYSEMIEDNTTWYLGTVGGGTSYKLAKYTDETGNTLTSSTTTSKVGLLRLGELMLGQFEKYYANGSATGLTTGYWTLTPYSASDVRYVYYNGNAGSINPTAANGVRPSINLKSNVVITGGDGTKNRPFTIELAS